MPINIVPHEDFIIYIACLFKKHFQPHRTWLRVRKHEIKSLVSLCSWIHVHNGGFDKNLVIKVKILNMEITCIQINVTKEIIKNDHRTCL
jgi:hypothetical protein